MTGEPILRRCEGSRTYPHVLPTPVLIGAPFGTLCSMCGQPVEVDDDGLAVEHQRDDLMARLARGDFG